MNYISLFVALLAARSSTSAILNRRNDLHDCAVKALKGTDATQRVVGPTDPTYTDARLGEKIQ